MWFKVSVQFYVLITLECYERPVTSHHILLPSHRQLYRSAAVTELVTGSSTDMRNSPERAQLGLGSHPSPSPSPFPAFGARLDWMRQTHREELGFGSPFAVDPPRIPKWTGSDQPVQAALDFLRIPEWG